MLFIVRKSYQTPFKNLGIFCHIKNSFYTLNKRFSQVLLSTRETVPVEKTGSLFYGLSTVTGRMFPGKDVTNKIQFPSIALGKNLWERYIKTGRLHGAMRLEADDFNINWFTQFVYVRGRLRKESTFSMFISSYQICFWYSDWSILVGLDLDFWQV